MSDRIQYFVQQTDDDRWALKRAKATRATKLFETKAEALEYSREFVRSNAPSTLVIKGQDGLIQEQHSYDPDPALEDADEVVEATGEAFQEAAVISAHEKTEKGLKEQSARLAAAYMAPALPLVLAVAAGFAAIQVLSSMIPAKRAFSQ
ncbi:MAG: DUF2188 domain-containing protein [Alphaproteobacteria bacterium]